MGNHNLPRERQADARAALLGREERHEDLLHHVLRHAGTIVGHFDDDVAAPVEPGRERNCRLLHLCRRLPAVAQHVQQHRLEQVAVGLHVQLARRDLALERDVVSRALGLGKAQHGVEQFAKIDALLLRRREARDLPVAVDELRQAVRAPRDRVYRVAQVNEVLVDRLTGVHARDDVFRHGDRGLRQRRHRRDRIHDLVRQHAHEVFPGLGLRRVEFRLDVLQRDQALTLPGHDDLGRGQRQVILDALDREGHQLPPARHRRLDGLGKTEPEAPQVLQLRNMFGAEQPPRGVVLQSDRIVGMQCHQRHRDMLDQRAQPAQLGLLVGTLFAQPVDDPGEGLAQYLEVGAFLLEVEALRVIGELRRVKEARQFAVGAAHEAPQPGGERRQHRTGDDRRAVIARLQQQPGEHAHGDADQRQPEDECDGETSKYHAFPCAGKGTRASARARSPPARC